MKTNPKRILALVMAVMLLATTMGALAVTASAEEIADNSYVLKYSGEGAKPYLYGSRYTFDHSYNDPAAGPGSVWSYNNAPEIFNLVNSTNGASIPAYCTDADTSTAADTSYRRINLEDSTYHANGAAAKLRSIILNSFPMKSVEEVAAAANASGYSVSDLAQGELISATQQAIWETTHGEKYTVDSHYDSIREMYEYDEGQFVYPDSLTATETDYTASNMTNLYNYFLSLEGTAPLADAVSEYSLENVVSTKQVNEDGSVTVTGYVNVNTIVREGDSLTLTATMGDQVLEQAVTAAGKYQFVFAPVSEVSDIKFVISGTQTGGDVYLFDAVGDRTTSQSMIGYDASTLPVYGEVTTNPSDRVLNIYKKAADGTTPLENISFSIYQVGTLEDWLNGKIAIGDAPTEADVAKYAVDGNLIATITTDKDGVASYNFGAVDGVYLVTELENSVISKPVEPFFIAVPNGDSDNLQYAVNVYPKNTVIEEDVEIEKDVTEIDQNEDTFDVNEVHTWIIQSSIPTGLATGQRYEISDTLDYRLTYKGNVTVTVAEKTAKAGEDLITLEESTDYTLAVSIVKDSAGNDVDKFVISLTASGMQKAAAVTGTEPEIRVSFDAVINSNAGLAEQIPNDAHVDYTNNVGSEYEADSDEPYVYTGGLKIHKTDASDITAKLAGAKFKIARKATDAEIAAGISEQLTVDKEILDIVYVSFYDTEVMSGEKVTEVTTNENGVGLIYGLAYGDYYLVETEAPDGYNKLTAPVAVKISAISHLDDDTSTEDTVEGTSVTVKNSAKFQLPDTGGVGTAMFTVMGIVFVAAAVLVIFLPGKKRGT